MMLNIKIDLDSELPIYKQIVEFIKSEIKNGNIRSSYKLPTVRALADEMKISVGTAKHAYDILEHQGIIEMVQGKGTFVVDVNEIENNIGFGYSPRASDLNKKEKSKRVMDTFINEMHRLSFSSKEIMMYLELRLKEKENIRKPIIVGVVDYDKQRLSYISNRIKVSQIGDIYKFFVDVDSKRIDNMLYSCDAVVIPSDVYSDFCCDINLKDRLVPLNIGITIDNVEIPLVGKKVGIISTDKYFANNVMGTIKNKNAETTTFMNYNMGEFIDSKDIILIGQSFTNFATEKQIHIISENIERKKVIVVKYNLDATIYGNAISKIKTMVRHK